MTWDLVVTCGGTGGHVLPALAVVDALVAAGLDRRRIGFVGARHGIETTLVPESRTPFVGLGVRGLPRGRTPAALAGRVRAVVLLASSVVMAWCLLRRTDARVVVGMGGYASLPTVLAAGRRRPVVLYESNAVAGLAVRIGARRASLVGTAFASTAAAVQRGRHVGFVVRDDIRHQRVNVAEARGAYGIDPGRTVIGVMGGSQGAASINAAVGTLTECWRHRTDIAILHLTGRSHSGATEVRPEVRPEARAAGLQYRAITFEDNMSRAYAACDLMVCRSGASTCAELAATGTPAICVPYPHATDDHQRHNAAQLVAAGAATMLDDGELNGATLKAAVNDLLCDPDKLRSMAAAAAKLACADGADVLAAEVLGMLESSKHPSKAASS